MNKFILRALLFFSYAIIFGVIYIVAFDFVFNPHSKIELLNNKSKNTQIIITGTSHTLMGLDPTQFFLKTINISEISKPIQVDIQAIENEIKKLPQLKYIVIPIDYFTLFYNGREEAIAKKYWHHWGVKNDEVSFFHFIDCQIPLPTDFISNSNQLSNFNPQNGCFNSKTEQKSISIKIDIWHKHWMRLDNFTAINASILHFINFCQNNNIKIVFIQMPLPLKTQEYLDLKYIALTNRTLLNFEKFPNTYLLNFNNNPIFKNDSLYTDCDHLNFKGAKIASSLLNEKIKNIESGKAD